MMRFTSTIGLVATLVLSTIATSAIAHPKLESSSPAPDASSAEAPKEIRLSFSEGVVAKFSGVELKDEGGKPVATGEPATDSNDKKQLVVPISGSLAPGRYSVNWHAVSDDTHRVEGRYSFQLAQDSASGEKSGRTERRPDSDLQAATKDEPGDKTCKCPSPEDKNVSRSRSDREDRMDDRRTRGNDRERERGDGYRSRDRDDGYRDGPRSRPECVIDDEGVKYCRVR